MFSLLFRTAIHDILYSHGNCKGDSSPKIEIALTSSIHHLVNGAADIF